MKQRRICWPNPDATCLEGGCVHCNGQPFRSIAQIRRWAERQGLVLNRCGDGQQDAMTAFTWGLRHHFANVETR